MDVFCSCLAQYQHWSQPCRLPKLVLGADRASHSLRQKLLQQPMYSSRGFRCNRKLKSLDTVILIALHHRAPGNHPSRFNHHPHKVLLYLITALIGLTWYPPHFATQACQVHQLMTLHVQSTKPDHLYPQAVIHALPSMDHQTIPIADAVSFPVNRLAPTHDLRLNVASTIAEAVMMCS